MSDRILQDCFTWLPYLQVKMMTSPLVPHAHIRFLLKSPVIAFSPNPQACHQGVRIPRFPGHAAMRDFLFLHTVEMLQLYLKNKRRCLCSADVLLHLLPRQIIPVTLTTCLLWHTESALLKRKA